MLTNDILADGFERVRDIVEYVVDGLDDKQLLYRPSKDANSIAWLVWHLARVQDDHIASAADVEQLWKKKWHKKFDLPYEIESIGYGQSSEEVSKMKANAKNLVAYYDDVYTMTIKYIKTLSEKDYAKIVDKNWEPPVTLAVRIMSVLNDVTQHAGQAAYIRGILHKL